VRQHIKDLDDFVRWLYPSVKAEPVVFEVFERASRQTPTGEDVGVRLELFAEARALVRQRNRPSWPEHNARAVREGLRAQGEVMTDWHAWTDLNRLINSLEQLTVPQQEIVRLITLYDDMGPAELAVVLRVRQDVAGDLLDKATTAFRAAFDDGDPTAEVEGVDRWAVAIRSNCSANWPEPSARRLRASPMPSRCSIDLAAERVAADSVPGFAGADPGWPESSQSWSAQVAALSPGRLCIGNGRLTRPSCTATSIRRSPGRRSQ